MSFAVISAAPIDADHAGPACTDALIAREDELRWLTAGLRTAQRGAGSLIVIEGGAGIGKSLFVREARRRARSIGMNVLARRGGAAGDPREFAAVAARVADDVPLLIAVDDVDMCDRESLHALAALALTLDDVGPVALVLTRRTDAPWCADMAALEAIVTDPGAIRIRLGPLDRHGVAEMVAAALGRDPEPGLAAAAHEVTAGNPFLVSELVLALGERAVDPPGDELRGVGLPSVARSVRARASWVGDGAWNLVVALAVLAQDATLTAAAALCGVDHAHAADQCGRLVTAGVLAGYDPPRFAQPLLLPAIRDAIPPAERLRLHGAAARTLASLGASVEVSARHLMCSAPAGDPWAAGILESAASAARERGCVSEAAAYVRRALAEGVPEREAQLVRALGIDAAALGDVSAAQHLERALELADSVRERALSTLALARLRSAAGAFGAARDACLGVLGSLREPGLEDLRTRLTAELVAAARFDGAPGPGIAATLAQLGSADDGDGGLVLALRADAAARAGKPRGGLAELARAAVAGGRLFEEEGSLIPHMAVAALAAAGQLDEAGALWDAALAACESRGLTWAAGAVRAHRAGTLLDRGCVASAIDDAQAATRLLADAGGPALWRATAHLAEALVEVGEVDRAAELVDAARPGAAGLDPRLAVATARVRIAQQRYADALVEAELAGDRFEAAGVRNPALAPWRSLAAECHCALGAAARARSLADEELSLARRFGAPAAQARALRVLGRASAPDGSEVELLREAAGLVEGSPAELESTRALIDLGEALWRAGEVAESRETLRRGMASAHRCGAAVLAARARDALVVAGGRPRRPIHEGLDGLTRTERRVAELAAAGLTNREIGADLFVTINTVSTHMRSIYRKLDISSRAQLPATLAP